MSHSRQKRSKEKKPAEATVTTERFVFLGSKVIDELRILLRLAAPSRR